MVSVCGIVAETEQGVALAILRCVIDFKREPWPQISGSAKSLVQGMLEPDPKKRLTAEQVLGKLFRIPRLDFVMSETLLFQHFPLLTCHPRGLN